MRTFIAIWLMWLEVWGSNFLIKLTGIDYFVDKYSTALAIAIIFCALQDLREIFKD